MDKLNPVQVLDGFKWGISMLLVVLLFTVMMLYVYAKHGQGSKLLGKKKK